MKLISRTGSKRYGQVADQRLEDAQLALDSNHEIKVV